MGSHREALATEERATPGDGATLKPEHGTFNTTQNGENGNGRRKQREYMFVSDLLDALSEDLRAEFQGKSEFHGRARDGKFMQERDGWKVYVTELSEAARAFIKQHLPHVVFADVPRMQKVVELRVNELPTNLVAALVIENPRFPFGATWSVAQLSPQMQSLVVAYFGSDEVVRGPNFGPLIPVTETWLSEARSGAFLPNTCHSYYSRDQQRLLLGIRSETEALFALWDAPRKERS